MITIHPERPDRSPGHGSGGQDDRQTVILRCLARLTTPVDLTELATWVFVTTQRPTTYGATFEAGVGREKARLHSVDLPQLEKMGLLTYDRQEREIPSYDVPATMVPDR